MDRICVIGYGTHSKVNILPSLNALGVSPIAIASEFFDSSNKEADYYKNYKEMINEQKPDCVLIVTKAENQYEITKYCISEKVKRIFVEKPMGMNVEEAKELETLASQNDCELFAGFMKRYSPCYKLLKDISSKKEFGKIKNFNAEFYITSGRSGWNNEIFLKKGGIHFCNLLIWLFGEIDEVKSFSNTEKEEVSLTSIIKFKSGVIGSLTFIGLSSWKGKREAITITGENGYVYSNGIREVCYHIDKPTSKAKRWQVLDEEITKVQPSITSASGGEQDLYLNGYVDALDAFLNSEKIKDNDNAATMEFIDLILNSINKYE